MAQTPLAGARSCLNVLRRIQNAPRRKRGELTRRRVDDFSRGDIDDVARVRLRRLRGTAGGNPRPDRWPKHPLHEQNECCGKRNGGSYDQARHYREQAEECDN